MAIFKRHEPGDAQQAAAAPAAEVPPGGSAELATELMPPFVSAGRAPAAGVVPPAAAPVYTMRPPEAAPRFELEADASLAEKVRMASEEAQQKAQEIVQERVRVDVQRPTTQSPANGARKRQVSRPSPLTQRALHTQLARQTFDPVRAAQTGLLNLAWSWQQAGAPIRAIHAYMQVLHRYPDTPAAAAAVADLVELSDNLAEKGQFHIALAIYDELEQLL